ncbi:MAG: hypothetical protein JWM21_3494 [Acidobacteria bacterium]|nr:hypothetical protein [Acidobacteriota bacterium]
MSKDDEKIAISADLSLPQTEPQGFTAEQMVRCEECLRANPPTRVECLYCGKALPLNETSAAFARPLLRPLEKWEKGYNCVLIKSPVEELSDQSMAEAARLLRLAVADLTRIIQSARPMPVARAATQEEAALIERNLRALGLETIIVSDEALALEASPPRRLRTIEVLEDNLVLLPTSGEGKTIAWSDINLILSGRLFIRQVETKERKRRGAEKQILDARETMNDEAVLDIFAESHDGGWRILANNFDFSCLGERKALLASENFTILTRLIRERAPQAEPDDSYHGLRRTLELVWPSEQQSSSLGWRRDRAGKYSTGEAAITSNETQFTRYSRLCHFLKSELRSEI